MVRIGVLSDTHLSDSPESASFLSHLAETYFSEVDMILHAGDVVSPGVLLALSPCPVHAVRGNMDPAVPELPPSRILRIEGLHIGLMHGWGPREGLVERIRREFAHVPLDCLVFGHSHVPLCEEQGGLLLFNPGSATDRRGWAYETVGMLEVGGGAIRGRIIPLQGRE